MTAIATQVMPEQSHDEVHEKAHDEAHDASPPAPPSPAIHLLPANLASVADCCSDGTTRYSMTGVRVRFSPNDYYIAEATDGHCLLRVQGPAPADSSEYPAWPAITSAPNGQTSAIIPSGDWRRAFRAIPKQSRRKANSDKPIANLAVVLGEKQVTLGSTDLEQVNTTAAVNLAAENRFPDADAVIKPYLDSTGAVVRVRVDAKLLMTLLKAISPFAGDESVVTLEFHKTDKTDKTDAPICVRAKNAEGQQAIGLLVPCGKAT